MNMISRSVKRTVVIFKYFLVGGHHFILNVEIDIFMYTSSKDLS